MISVSPLRILSIVLGIVCAAVAAEVTPLPIGSNAPDFDLPGVDGRRHTLAEFAAAKVLVVVFTCNHCPTAQAYESRLIDLANDYRGKGVAVVAINPNDPQALRLDELGYTDLSDSFEEMKLRASERKFPFPYLDDGATQKVAHAYGALATPHIFIFDAGRKLRYQGRVDDSDVREVKSHDARNAIESLLAGKAPAIETTRVFGCSTKWAEKREDAKKSIEKWNQEPVKLDSINIAGIRELAKNEGEKSPLRLISAWATWCGPCVEELPELVEIQRMYRRRGFELVTLSMDEPGASEQVLRVLQENHCSGTNVQFAGDNRDAMMKALDEKWAGPIPHTILVAPGGKVLYRETGSIEPLKLKRAIVDFLGRTYASRPVADKIAR